MSIIAAAAIAAKSLFQHLGYLFPDLVINVNTANQFERLHHDSSYCIRDKITCPYEYILGVYGPSHFTTMVGILDPQLRSHDPEAYKLILEIMDAVHFGAILVDDVADNSLLRKGHTAAHRIYGSCETVNRAYLRVMEVIVKCSELKPTLLPYILDSLNEIHKGQDISLVWRRDGFDKGLDRTAALQLYRQCAYLKTGGLFRLVGQLVFQNHERDVLMSTVGWYCHLQNDCKNVFSSDVVAAKGALAEDLMNGEYSFPILTALYSSPYAQRIMEDAMPRSRLQRGRRARDHAFEAAMEVLQSSEVKNVCMEELKSLKDAVSVFAEVWGRKEVMILDQPA